MKQYKVSVSKTTATDSYEHGELMEGMDQGEVFHFSSSDLSAVSERLESYTNIKVKDCELIEGSDGDELQTCLLETEDGFIANDHQIAIWKKDKLKLYAAHYSISLSMVETTDLDASLLQGGLSE